ncbi:MAG: type II toxin-antitoxin system RelE/ParE family toxin [Pseudomonadales bacterium]|nr:type II toxin-antitoxin system RelE/ParE family toxin [Pseudomonadales bacterium]
MAKIIWTEPALDQLDEIAEYIALDNPVAASELVARIFKKVDRLERFPNSGREPPELPDSIYREVVSKPCRIFYRCEGKNVLILHVMRDEMELKKYLLSDHARARMPSM